MAVYKVALELSFIRRKMLEKCFMLELNQSTLCLFLGQGLFKAGVHQTFFTQGVVLRL